LLPWCGFAVTAFHRLLTLQGNARFVNPFIAPHWLGMWSKGFCVFVNLLSTRTARAWGCTLTGLCRLCGKTKNSKKPNETPVQYGAAFHSAFLQLPREEAVQILKDTQLARDVVPQVSCKKRWYSRTASPRANTNRAPRQAVACRGALRQEGCCSKKLTA